MRKDGFAGKQACCIIHRGITAAAAVCGWVQLLREVHLVKAL
jgi:hypothetical protein